MHISKIGRDSYFRFIAEKFSESSKKIEDRTIDSILDWADGYTYCVQLLCNRIFLSSGRIVAREGGTSTPTASDFITRNSPGNPSTVLQSLHTLQKKELIYRETGEDGKPYYGVYDLLFRRWIE